MSQISQTEYVRRLQNSTKEILKIGRRQDHALSNKQNDVPITRFCFVNFCRQQQKNQQKIITQVYTAIAPVIVAVEVCLIKLPKTE